MIVTGKAACYSPVDRAQVLVVDPLRARLVAQRELSGPTTIVATAPTRDGLALLLAPPGRRSGARLVLVAATRARTIRLPALRARPRPLDKSLLGSAIGLAVDREGGRAYLVEPEARVLEVDLASGKVGVNAPAFPKTAAAAKGIPSSVVQAVPLRPGLLGITGIRRAPRGRLRPLGLRLLDTRNRRSRLLEPAATGMARVGTTLLAFQPSFDQLGGGIPAIGLRGYSFDGSIRFRALHGRPIVSVRAQGRYAYAAGPTVIDLSDGRVEAPGPNAISVSPFELLVGQSS